MTNIPQVSPLELQKLYRRYGPEFTRHLQQSYGDLFTVKLPFLPPLYFALHPDEVYGVLSRPKPPLEKPALMRRVLQSSFGNGLFTSQGEVWRRQRRLMQPAFYHGALAQYAERMVGHTTKMLASWQVGQRISLGEVMHELTLAIALDALFSVREAEGNTAVVIHQAITDLGQGLAAQSQSQTLAMFPDWVPLPALRQKRRGEQALARSVQQLIAQRRALGEADAPPDLLSTLLWARDDDDTTGAGMSDQQLQDELITLYIAGHDTTAILLSWTWLLLAQYPMVAEKLREELARVLHGRVPTFADYPNLPYTQMIIKESLRLYPPAWFLFREADHGLTLRDQPIPPASIIFLMPYTTQRDARWFPNPDSYQPERWDKEAGAGLEKSLPKGAYFPFGMGPRTCIGNGFALLEATLVLATIAQQFRMEPLNLQDAKLGHTATLGFTTAVFMRLLPA